MPFSAIHISFSGRKAPLMRFSFKTSVYAVKLKTEVDSELLIFTIFFIKQGQHKRESGSGIKLLKTNLNVNHKENEAELQLHAAECFSMKMHQNAIIITSHCF